MKKFSALLLAVSFSVGLVSEALSSAYFPVLFKKPNKGVFGPESVSGLILDLDPMFGVTLNGSDVASITEQSVNAQVLAQGTAANQPVYTASNSSFKGFPTIDFHKAQTEWLSMTSGALLTHISGTAKPITVFLVAKRNTKVTATETPYSFGKTSTVDNYIDFQYSFSNSNSQRPRVRMRGESTGAAEESTQGRNESIDFFPHVMAWTFDSSANTSCYTMGDWDPYYGLTTTNVTGDYADQADITPDNFTVGALRRSTVSQPVEMELARLLIYSRALSAEEIKNIGEFLWNRYINQDMEVSDFNPDHDWNADNITEGIGARVATLPDSGSGDIDFTQSTFINQPTVYLGPDGHKALRFDGIFSYMTAGVAANWPKLHNNTDKTLVVVYRQVSEDSAKLHPIIDTVDNNTVSRDGVGIYENNIPGDYHKLQIKIGATNATSVISRDTVAYGVKPLEWHIGGFTFEASPPSSEENLTHWVDNENWLNEDINAITPSASNPTYTLTLGKLANTSTFANIDVLRVLYFSRKLSWPYEMNLLNKALAKEYGIGISSLVAGSGYTNVIKDATPHRGFPDLIIESDNDKQVIYRRGVDHGSSRGVAVIKSSSSGIDWPTDERVVYDVAKADGGGDVRIGSGFIRLTRGERAGRLIWVSELSEDNSDLAPGSVYAWYSDDLSSYTRVHINPEQSGYDGNGSAGALLETQTGKVLMTFAASEPGEGSGDQDLYLSESLDGGTTWSQGEIIVDHDDIAWRITEAYIQQDDDGTLVMLIRDDTNHDIYRMLSTDDGETWSALQLVCDNWGWPNHIKDESGRSYGFFRSSLAEADAVWRYSDDNWVTTSNEYRLSNKIGVVNAPWVYGTMTYTSTKMDSNGDIWAVYGAESVGSDVYIKRWRKKPNIEQRIVTDGILDAWWPNTFIFDDTESVTEYDDRMQSDQIVGSAPDVPTVDELSLNNGSGLSFNGSQYFDMTNRNYTTDFEIGWVSKVSDFTTQRPIVSPNGALAGGAGIFQISPTQTKMVMTNTKFVVWNHADITSGSGIAIHRIVHDSSEQDLRHYVNGVQSTVDPSSTAGTTDHSISINQIGKHTGDGTFFLGLIGNIWYGPTALTDSQANEYYGFLGSDNKFGTGWTES